MRSLAPVLCERCQEREATIFITHCTHQRGGETTTTSRNLCEACQEIEDPGAAARIAAQLAAGCRYCGAKVDTTFCKPCGAELFRFIRLKGQSFSPSPGAPMTPERRAQMAKDAMELDQHMKEWVAQRKREAGE